MNRFVIIAAFLLLSWTTLLDVIVRAQNGQDGDNFQDSRQKKFLESFARDQPNWLPWTSSTPCSISCGGRGFRERTRECSSGQNADCQAQGGRHWEVQICDNGPCNAVWLEWGPLSDCSVSCGYGVQARLRNCSTGSLDDCDTVNNYELKVCDAGSCEPTTTATKPPPAWSEWTNYIPCSTTCGPGFSQRIRSCSSGKSNDCAGKSYEINTCNVRKCNNDGSWSDWSTWTMCTTTCGSGNRTRSRSCDYPDPSSKGDPCLGYADETKTCNDVPCPVNGMWSEWGQFTSCSKTCGGGMKSRQRVCTFPDNVPQGADCVGPDTENTTCNEVDCPVDGSWTPWSTWASCTKSCQGGLRFKARICVYDESKPHGKACGGDNIETEACNTGECVVDGAWSNWLSWSQCTHSCGGGLRSHSRTCVFRGSLKHGKDCTGNTTEIQNCGQTECPVDGQWSMWGAWASCSATCGGGTSVRNRNCTYASSTAPKGKTCVGDGFEKKNCSTKLCPVDASWTEWTRYSHCSVTCGTGERVRTRNCTYDPVAPVGRDCSGLSEDRQPCVKQKCPVDGELLPWGGWSRCSASCSGGYKSRTRQCHFPNKVPHGKDCQGKLDEKTTCNDFPCPTTTPATTTTTLATVDGHWSNWSLWSPCTQTCGSGTQDRNRTCTYPDHTLHGEKCPGSNNQTKQCNKDLCPVDGVWSEWSVYGRCSVTCGNGTRTRNRTCDYDAVAPQGDPCAGNSSSETIECSPQLCPVDGFWSNWYEWSQCTETCGGGTQRRQRTCEFTDGFPHGAGCVGDNTENQNCSTQLCPVDGVLTNWSAWTECTVTCGGGTHTKNRTCYFPDNVPHGNDCVGRLKKKQSCNNDLCAVDGVWSNWEEWSSCTTSCGGGIETRHRTCQYDDHAPHGTACTGPTEESQRCGLVPCPVDGHFSEWSMWSSCSTTCGNGTHSRARKCLFVTNAPKGDDCNGTTAEQEDCNNGTCPVDGVLSVWSSWTPCTVSCGNGTSERNRSCDFPPNVPKGENCTGSLKEVIECGTDLCPIDGMLDPWSEWTSCSLTCGGGSQQRNRSCQFDPVAPRGNNCTGPWTDVQSCSDDPCPVDGRWSEWGDFSNCSTTCGNGTQYRTRQCEFKDGFPHGENCTGSRSDAQECNTNPCPVDGKLSVWSDWTECTKSCNNGTKMRNRTCDFPDGLPRGDDCQGDLNETVSCHEDPCPIDGHWSDWSNYTDCTVSCDGGKQTRNRTCIFDKDVPHGAKCFGNVTEVRDCETTPCPVDGVWGDWQSWSSCSVSCGGGKAARKRGCEFKDGIPHGLDCIGDETEIKDCSTDLCAVDGKLTEWSSWTQCSATCGSGVHFRTRRCEFDPVAPAGKNCTEILQEQEGCINPTPCPVDGFWTKWGRWSTCSDTCGGGQRTRRRNCYFPPGAPTGQYCAGLGIDKEVCNNASCPVDGTWSTWTDFSNCSTTCGGGSQTRTRNCTFPDGSQHGNPCPGPVDETRKCNENECPQDAVWAAWSEWTTCTVSCGGGNQSRVRVCNWPSSTHGNNCTGDGFESQACSTDLCPVDGVWNEWGEWGSCSVTCNVGLKSRNRTCVYDPVAPQGTICVGASEDKTICAPGLCAIDGQWTSWQNWGPCSTTCGNGTEFRQRRCAYVIPGAPHGKDCEGEANQTRECSNADECPVDGYWDNWSAWSACSATCGDATHTRNRTCLFDESKPHGFDCFGEANETEFCRLGQCPVDGLWNSWSGWSTCTATCAGGMKSRNRTCTFSSDSAPHGAGCSGNSSEIVDCNIQPCAVDGAWNGWSTWTSCSSTCGDGSKSRNRTCVFTPDTAPHGADCAGNDTETAICNEKVCSVDGILNGWSVWTSCSATCGNGFKSRNRTCVFTPGTAPHGADCAGNDTETAVCNVQVCAVDGAWNGWNTWTSCSSTCGDGSKSRNRTCVFTSDTAPHGADCAGNDTETAVCNVQVCAVDGVWNGWSAWTNCSATCGDGSKSRNRTCVFTPDTAPHGADCAGNDTETAICNEKVCPVDGVWNTWSVWTSCSATCGDGSKSRNRTCVFTPDTAPHGADCAGNDTETAICNEKVCPVDGIWGTWSAWTSCLLSCGGGIQRRNRTCEFGSGSAPHGADCVGNSTEISDCNVQDCPVDGNWTTWSSWGACSATCGSGIEIRTRTCYFPPSAVRGADCVGSNAENQTCTKQACPPTTPPPPHSCFQCIEYSDTCEDLTIELPCQPGATTCINNITNLENGSRLVDRWCGTLDDCRKGWYELYSGDEKCVRFDEDQIYTSAFYCEFCCVGNDCNEYVNMQNKYFP